VKQTDIWKSEKSRRYYW